MEELENTIVEVLKSIFDPEIPVDIYELGLIYEVKIDILVKFNFIILH